MTVVSFFLEKYNFMMTWKASSNIEFPAPACSLPSLIWPYPRQGFHIHVDTPANVCEFCITSYNCIGIDNYLNKIQVNKKEEEGGRKTESLCARVRTCAVWPAHRPALRCPVLASCVTWVDPPPRSRCPRAKGSHLHLAWLSPFQTRASACPAERACRPPPGPIRALPFPPS